MTPEDGPPAAGDEPGPDPDSREARFREREARRRGEPQAAPAGPRRPRSRIERGVLRLIATCGIVGIGVLLGAVLVGQNVAGWIVGLVVSAVSIILLAALLRSSRQL